MCYFMFFLHFCFRDMFEKYKIQVVVLHDLVTTVHGILFNKEIFLFNFFSVCLRLQVNPQNKQDFAGISPERAFADFIFANITLHLVVMNFIG